MRPFDSNTIRVLIADDHALVREGLKSTFERTGIRVVAEASTTEAAQRLALAEEVDVILMDIKMPDGNGLDVIEEIMSAKPDVAVLIYSCHDRRRHIARSYALGANGFLVKGVEPAKILEAIRVVRNGKSVWTAEQLRLARDWKTEH